MLAEAATRALRCTVACGGQARVLVTESRFVTGLGRSHPVENGFAWHPTLGVPYLPGSSIKGMVRAWAEREAPPNAELAHLFGPRGAGHAVGDLIFLDAIPLAPVRLEIDVLTPHYAGWTRDDLPGDWRAPVPVPFLVVAPQVRFLFAIQSRRRDASAIARAVAWLIAAAWDAGAGAKTAVGYGRFALDPEETDKRQRANERERSARAAQLRRATLEHSARGRWQLALEPLAERDVLDRVRLRLEETSGDLEDRLAFAHAVCQLPYFADWLRGKVHDRTIRTSPDKIKARARALASLAAQKAV
ncbi:MAG TPA: type III-B CRISPR module RAMP protein Cmr6 [Kofleriaceae bacterium]|nr:type III-B CRISPR module RAMP protein Cmr6 [Kofleriaceae bacterium]